MVVPMERFRQSFIEKELNLQPGLLDGVLNELRPPRIHDPFLINPRTGRMSAGLLGQLWSCGLATFVHWFLG